MRDYCETFVVESRYPFPMDMLRYDGCYPADTESANAITDSIDPEHRPGTSKYRVRLFATQQRFVPTVARWESFMWKVVEVNHEPASLYYGSRAA